MCLILLAYRSHPKYPLVVAANRDEFYARPSQDAHFWPDEPNLLAGRDLEAGGTWLGVTRQGRFAAVTNYAEPNPADAPLSRGALVQNFLAGSERASAYAGTLDKPAYRGFNLLLWDGEELAYTSNRADNQVLEPGIYGMANAELGAQWPKVIRGRENLQQALNNNQDQPAETALVDLLNDRIIPPDSELPNTGRPLAQARRTASCFIAGDDYGTRASTSLWLGPTDIHFAEHNFGPSGEPQQISRHHWSTQPTSAN